MSPDAPSWPRLAGEMATATPRAVRGRWRTRADGREASGTFVHRPPDLTVAVHDDGSPAELGPHLLRPTAFERGEDYHRAAGPVVAVEHDGRPCWRVELVPPAHKSGLLVLVVDDATGLRLHQSNPEHDRLEEVTDLDLDAGVSDAELAPLLAARRAAEADAERYALAQRRPVPSPAWFPSRRLLRDEEPDCWLVMSDRGEGAVSRAPAGSTAPVPDWLHEPVVHRLERGGWSWAVASRPAMSPQDAARVVDEALAAGPG